MINESLFANGSACVRTDFHMHTNADKEFKYSHEEGKNYFEDYVNALEKSEIKIAAITNHNKFDVSEFKNLRKEARKKGIFLLPGIELSVKDGKKGIHTLVIFSDVWFINQTQTNHIQSFLTSTFSGQENFETENSQSNDDLIETIRKLDGYQGKDYFIICAHVEADNGLWGGFEGASIIKFGKSEPFRSRCLGFQKVRTNDLRLKVQSWLDNWYPAEVEGCDCKSIEEIGRGKSCYLKVGDFTFEAIKYALMDHKNRLHSEPLVYSHSYIKSIKFEGSKLGNQTLSLSPEMNTFIGIRGSGKSSIIETIRYLLDIDFGETASDRDYKNGSVNNALGSGGKITLTAINRQGREYEIRRILDESPDVYFGDEPQPGINIRETIIHKPLYFGQKDLSNTGIGFEIDLVEKLVGEILSDTRHELELLKQQISDTTQQLSKLSDVEENYRDHENKLLDAEHRLTVFNEHKIEEKLQKQLAYETDDRQVKLIEKFTFNYLQDLEEFIENHKKRIYDSP